MACQDVVGHHGHVGHIGTAALHLQELRRTRQGLKLIQVTAEVVEQEVSRVIGHHHHPPGGNDGVHGELQHHVGLDCTQVGTRVDHFVVFAGAVGEKVGPLARHRVDNGTRIQVDGLSGGVIDSTYSELLGVVSLVVSQPSSVMIK